LNFRTIDDLPLMSRDDVAVRLSSYIVPNQRGFHARMTLKDIARLSGYSEALVSSVANDRIPVSDK
jgi:hypothetical protein